MQNVTFNVVKQKIKPVSKRPTILPVKPAPLIREILLIGASSTPEALFSGVIQQLDSFGIPWRYSAGKISTPPTCIILALPPSQIKRATKTLPPVPIIFWPQSEGDNLKSLRQASLPIGIPLARVAIGSAGAVNSALLAASFLALRDAALRKRLISFRKKQTRNVLLHPIPGQTSKAKTRS